MFSHFKAENLTPDLYIIDWMFTLYAKSLPLDVASRVWDVFCRDGEEFLFRTALGKMLQQLPSAYAPFTSLIAEWERRERRKRGISSKLREFARRKGNGEEEERERRGGKED